jgi:peptidoglycan/LPS O-acetylase OafA/YrhL
MSYAALLLVISIQVFVNLKYLLEGSPIPEGIPMDFVTLILAFTLMQVFSLNAQLLLYPLWSLSVEWITNIIAAIVSVKIKFIGLLFFIVPGIFFLVVSLSQLTSGAVESVTNQLGRGMWAFGLGLMLQERKRMLTLLHNNFAKIMIVFICTYISVQLSISFSAWSSLGSPVLFAVAICYLDSIDEHKLGKGLMKVCKYLGRTSYGVYVWHVVASNLLALAIKNHLIKSDFLELYFGIPKAFLVFLITIVFTELTLRYLEAPLRARLTRG